MRRLSFTRTIIGALALSVGLTSIYGQNAGTNKRADPSLDSPIESKTVAAMSKADRMFYLRSFVDRAQAFSDRTNGVEVMTGIASVTWKYDSVFARETFAKALGIIDYKRRSFSDDADYRNSPWPALRMRTIIALARYDGEWSKRLLADYGESTRSSASSFNRGSAYYDIATDLVSDDPARAAEYGLLSIKWGAPRYFVGLLYELKKKDPAAADRLFVQALDALVAEPTVIAEDFALYGTYIFTSVGLSDLKIPNRYLPTYIGGQDVVDLRVDRSDASPEIVIAYIRAAAKIFSRTVSDPNQTKQYYIYTRMLLPHAQRISPLLASDLNQIISGLLANVPNEVTDNSEYDKPILDFFPSMENAENDTNKGNRDNKYSFLIDRSLDQKDFTTARKLTERIDRIETRTNYNLLIDSALADQAIERRDFTTAEDIIHNMPDCQSSAMLWLGLGNARLQRGEMKKTIEAVNASLAISYKLNRPIVPYLLLAAAAIQAQAEPDIAEITFSQAIKRFNSEKPENLKSQQLYLEASDDDSGRLYHLKMKTMEFGFTQSLSSLMNLNPLNTIQNVMLLDNETLLGNAMIGISSWIAKTK